MRREAQRPRPRQARSAAHLARAAQVGPSAHGRELCGAAGRPRSRRRRGLQPGRCCVAAAVSHRGAAGADAGLAANLQASGPRDRQPIRGRPHMAFAQGARVPTHTDARGARPLDVRSQRAAGLGCGSAGTGGARSTTPAPPARTWPDPVRPMLSLPSSPTTGDGSAVEPESGRFPMRMVCAVKIQLKRKRASSSWGLSTNLFFSPKKGVTSPCRAQSAMRAPATARSTARPLSSVRPSLRSCRQQVRAALSPPSLRTPAQRPCQRHQRLPAGGLLLRHPRVPACKARLPSWQRGGDASLGFEGRQRGGATAVA